MKSRTSFFNGTVLKKDITRFSPLWALYTIFLALTFMVMDMNIEEPGEMADAILDTVSGMSVLNFLYAGAAAAMLFGDLFQSRMCNALHAFPMRREGWLLTHLTAGMLFCLVPNLLVVLLAGFPLKSQFYIGLLWLAVTALQYLFFFGIAVFSALCAGSRLGMAAVYGLINFLSLLVYYLAYTFYVPLLHGIETQLTYFTFFCPTVYMSDFQYVSYSSFFEQLQGVLWEQWFYLFAVAGIGVAAMVLALLLYHRRHLEYSGDLISVGFLRPVFLVIVTIGAGAVMHAIGSLFSNTMKYVFSAVGLTVGFFAGRMLLMRTVKVFQIKAFGIFALLVAALGLSMGLTRLDPLGITTYVPDPGQVEQVTISTTPNRYYDYYRGPTLTLKDEASVAEILALHQDLSTQPDAEHNALSLYIDYTLKGGKTLRRHYRVGAASEQGQLLNKYLSSWQCVFQTDNWEGFKGSVEKIYTDYPSDNLPPEAWDDLLEAMYQDCLDGNMAQEWSFHSKEESAGWVEIATYEGKSQTNYLSLNIYDSCSNTIAVLNKYAKTHIVDY